MKPRKLLFAAIADVLQTKPSAAPGSTHSRYRHVFFLRIIYSENRSAVFDVMRWSLFARDLIRKPVSTFRDHALVLHQHAGYFAALEMFAGGLRFIFLQAGKARAVERLIAFGDPFGERIGLAELVLG